MENDNNKCYKNSEKKEILMMVIFSIVALIVTAVIGRYMG